MKKLYALLFAFGMLLAINVQGQSTAIVDIADVTKFPGTVEIPIDVDFSGVDDGTNAGVGTFEFSIEYDSDVLTGFLYPANLATGITTVTYDESNGSLSINWEGLGSPLTTNGKLFDMVFTYAGGFSNIVFVDTFVAGETELGYVNGDQITDAEFNDGSISERTAPIPVSQWAFFLGFGLMALFLVIRVIRIL